LLRRSLRASRERTLEIPFQSFSKSHLAAAVAKVLILMLRSCFLFSDAGLQLLERLCGDLMCNKVFTESFVVGYFESLPSFTSIHFPTNGDTDQASLEGVSRVGLFLRVVYQASFQSRPRSAV
jgi:uncharacterized membrane protein